MDTVAQTIQTLLDSLVNDQSVNALSYYSLNEFLGYAITYGIMWKWFIKPMVNLFNGGIGK